jgi:hypothetical protein
MSHGQLLAGWCHSNIQSVVGSISCIGEVGSTEAGDEAEDEEEDEVMEESPGQAGPAAAESVSWRKSFAWRGGRAVVP